MNLFHTPMSSCHVREVFPLCLWDVMLKFQLLKHAVEKQGSRQWTFMDGWISLPNSLLEGIASAAQIWQGGGLRMTHVYSSLFSADHACSTLFSGDHNCSTLFSVDHAYSSLFSRNHVYSSLFSVDHMYSSSFSMVHVDLKEWNWCTRVSALKQKQMKRC